MFDPFCCAYAPEKSVRRLIIGILKETVLPQMRVTAERFPELRVNLDSVEDPWARKSDKGPAVDREARRAAAGGKGKIRVLNPVSSLSKKETPEPFSTMLRKGFRGLPFEVRPFLKWDQDQKPIFQPPSVAV